MNNETVTILSAAFELAFPALLAVATLRWPRIRRWSVVILGAVTPFLLFYAFTTVAFFLEQEAALLGFNAMWDLSLIPFALSIALGAALSIVPVPRTASARYVFGFAVSAVLALAWALWVPQ
jgi:hypothetical protein